MLKKGIIYAIICLAAAVSLALCSCSKRDKTVRIGVSQCSSDDWRSKMNEEIMREAMFHDNVEVEIRSADDSNEKQISDLQYFVDNGFDIIVAAPNEADALTTKIKEIYDSGMPVVVFDRKINGESYTAFQGADNVEIGALAARLAYSMLGDDCRVIEIEGLEGSSPAIDRQSGFHSEAAKLGIAVLGSENGNWNAEEGGAAARSLLAAHPKANIVFAHNDRMAIAASEAARAMGRDVKVIGIDAAPQIGIQAVADSVIDASFLYPTDGEQLVRTALAIINGEPYERNFTLPTPAAVDLSNAEILLLQDSALREETGKIDSLMGVIDKFWERHSVQTAVLYAVVAILLLSAGFIFLLLRSYWTGKRHRDEIEARNAELSKQRDELDGLYQQLQDATASKLTFFTNVSHDLRTPLTLIADPVSQMAQADNLTERQHVMMQLADKNVKRLQRLINQILDIRKFDNGQLKLNMAEVNLGESLRNWATSFSELARKRHIALVADIPDDKSIVLSLDAEKMERIIFNLLSNAFKFTPDNGSINVSLRQDGDNALIKVSDTGIGIPADEINHVMERFFRTETINPNGSGIGLALSKVFVEMQGGTISVESTVKVGTTFSISLPIRHNEAEAAGAYVASGAIDTAEIEDVEPEDIEISEDLPTVLVIDDSKDICTLLRSELSGKYAVITAHTGAQGVKLATKYVPDLIICDVMMPGMDGYEVCRRIKDEELTSHIPVLLLTACSLDAQRIEGYNSRADAYMQKPFDTSMLIARSESLIANRRIIFEKGAIKPAPNADAAKTLDTADEFVKRFTEAVECDISNADLSVEALARQMGVSRVQLYRKIKATTNYSAAEYIRNIRLKHAAVILKTTDSTVSEAAYSVGFASPSYFTRCYKDFYGESPSDTHSRIYKGK